MNSDHLKYFSSAHQSLLEALNSIQPFLRAYPQAKPRLRELASLLVVLFAKEDQAFFDTLYAFYKEDRPSTKMIDFLVHDLKEAKLSYLIFSEKHSGESGDIHARSFPKDFTDFARELTQRVKMEEEYLFPLLRKMASA
jgi:hypothetical protein